MRSTLFIAICIFLASCNPKDECSTSAEGSTTKASGSGSGCEQPGEVELPEPDGDVPVEASNFEASIKFVNFSLTQEEKVHKAIDIIKTVVASREFRTKVINFTYNGKRQYVDNKGLTNEQIYEKVLKGAETLMPAVDYEMDLELELYNTSNNVIGYTYPNTVRVWMNTKYFTPYTPSEVAGNLFHEWTHKLGFDHAATYSVSRDSSVPYALGYMIRDMGKQFE